MSEKCHQRKCPTLFDHLISAGQRGWRHCRAQRIGGLEIDDELEKGLSQPDLDRISVMAAWPDQPAGAHIGRM
jgi:hypothetical protein